MSFLFVLQQLWPQPSLPRSSAGYLCRIATQFLLSDVREAALLASSDTLNLLLSVLTFSATQLLTPALPVAALATI